MARENENRNNAALTAESARRDSENEISEVIKVTERERRTLERETVTETPRRDEGRDDRNDSDANRRDRSEDRRAS